MTELTQTMDVAAITSRAREVKFWVTVARLLATVLFGLGFITRRAFALTWLGMVWVAFAFQEGWQAGKPPATPQPDEG